MFENVLENSLVKIDKNSLCNLIYNFIIMNTCMTCSGPFNVLLLFFFKSTKVRCLFLFFHLTIEILYLQFE